MDPKKREKSKKGLAEPAKHQPPPNKWGVVKHVPDPASGEARFEVTLLLDESKYVRLSCESFCDAAFIAEKFRQQTYPEADRTAHSWYVNAYGIAHNTHWLQSTGLQPSEAQMRCHEIVELVNAAKTAMPPCYHSVELAMTLDLGSSLLTGGLIKNEKPRQSARPLTASTAGGQRPDIGGQHQLVATASRRRQQPQRQQQQQQQQQQHRHHPIHDQEAESRPLHQLDVEQHQQQQHNHDPELAAPGRRGQPLLPLPSTAARGRHQPQQQQNDVCRPLVTERFTGMAQQQQQQHTHSPPRDSGAQLVDMQQVQQLQHVSNKRRVPQQPQQPKPPHPQQQAQPARSRPLPGQETEGATEEQHAAQQQQQQQRQRLQEDESKRRRLLQEPEEGLEEEEDEQRQEQQQDFSDVSSVLCRGLPARLQPQPPLKQQTQKQQQQEQSPSSSDDDAQQQQQQQLQQQSQQQQQRPPWTEQQWQMCVRLLYTDKHIMLHLAEKGDPLAVKGRVVGVTDSDAGLRLLMVEALASVDEPHDSVILLAEAQPRTLLGPVPIGSLCDGGYDYAWIAAGDDGINQIIDTLRHVDFSILRGASRGRAPLTMPLACKPAVDARESSTRGSLAGKVTGQ